MNAEGPDDLLDSLRGPLREHYQRKSDELEKAIARTEEVRIRVLVLGRGEPPEGSDEAYNKRCQIRDELNAIPGVSAFFPEDEALADLLHKKSLIPKEDLYGRNLILGDFVDVIIALESENAEGVKQEVAQLSQVRQIAWKIFDLMPKKWEETASTSYPGRQRVRLVQYYYCEEEFFECSLATRTCPQHVRGEQAREAF